MVGSLILAMTLVSAGDRTARPPRQVQQRFYSEGGRLLGKSTTQNGVTRYYSPGGRFEGRIETRGRTSRYYDSGGRFRGRGVR